MGPDKALERRSYGPGMHGGMRMRRKQSEYAIALAEKQKLKFQYGVLEKQFRKYYEQAASRRGVTGDMLLQALELRLDNIVYRLGFATTRRFARQIVTHGHIVVNGGKVDIPSFQCRVGDVVEVRNSPKSRQIALKSLDATQINGVPEWLTRDADAFKGSIAHIPSREEIAPIANEQLVVELYSRS